MRRDLSQSSYIILLSRPILDGLPPPPLLYPAVIWGREMWSTVRTKCIRLLQVWGEQRLLPENTAAIFLRILDDINIYACVLACIYITTINNNHVYNFRQSPYEIKKESTVKKVYTIYRYQSFVYLHSLMHTGGIGKRHPRQRKSLSALKYLLPLLLKFARLKKVIG